MSPTSIKNGASIASLVAVAGVLVGACAPSESARDYIVIVGSSTVYPFSTVVAERFGRASDYRTPKVEATGSGGGFKLFCAGIGVDHPDIANSSRRIKTSEIARCADNGVRDIVEVKVGYDGIVLAHAAGVPPVSLTRRQLWLALARDVPAPDGSAALVANPYTRWSDIGAGLPDARIEVFGPPPTSGTRDAFADLALTGGCRDVPWIRALEVTDGARFRAICQTVREDGHFVEAGENDNLVVQKLRANPDALGIIGFSFLDQHGETLRGARIDGFAPTFANIASRRYPVSRALYLYVKRAHIDMIPGLRAFLREFTSERAWSPDGYLAARGLIPMTDAERAEVFANVLAMSPVVL